MKRMLSFLLVFFLKSLIFCQTPAYFSSPKADSMSDWDVAIAIKLYSDAIQKDPQNIANYYRISCAYTIMNQFDSAFSYLWGQIEKRSNDNWVLGESDLLKLHTYKKWDLLRRTVLSAVKPAAASFSNADNTTFNGDLYARLLEMEAKDEAYESPLALVEKVIGYNSQAAMAIRDLKNIYWKENEREFDTVISIYGWPKISIVNRRGVNAAFVIVQHSDVAKQKMYLPIIKDLCKRNESDWNSYALMYDRIAMIENKPQAYGTQTKYNTELNKMEVYPIEDELNVDERRKSIGLESLKTYLSRLGIEYKGTGK